MDKNLEDPTRGMALLCNQDGVVVAVLHNDLGIPASELVGKPFPLLVSGSSFQKALSFLVELKSKRTIFDWEFDLSVENRLILVHCAGLVFDGRLLVIAAKTRSAIQNLFKDMMRMNNEQTNLSRSITKEQVELNRIEPEHQNALYDELTHMNNELVSLQRELALKNAELERLNDEVKRLASVDDLTRIYNRRGFFELGNREVARAIRFGQSLAAIMLDIDHFKRFNDTYGHAIGDLVLKQVVSRCSPQLRNVDVFGRYGGEEFAVLLPETQREDAGITAERLRHHISSEPFDTEDGPLSVTISLGVAALEGEATSLEELLELADQALYQAKESGRNRVCVKK